MSLAIRLNEIANEYNPRFSTFANLAINTIIIISETDLVPKEII